MPFQWRIGLFTVLALLVTLLLQFSLGFVLFNRSLSRDLKSDLSHYANWLEEGLVETPQGLVLAPESLAVLKRYEGYAEGRARVLGVRSRPVFVVGGAFPDDTSGWLVTRRPVLDGYVLEAAVSRRSHDRELRDYLQLSLLGLPLFIMVLGAGGLWLSWRLLRPLRRLQETVTEVSASSNLSARVEVGRANDELSTLARSYNLMMARLERFFERERTFTRYASHELRNPVTALRVQVDAALAGNLSAERVLPTLKRELARLSAMLDGLLILARDQAPAKTPLDLAELARESVDRARLLAVNQAENQADRDSPDVGHADMNQTDMNHADMNQTDMNQTDTAESLFIDYSGPASLLAAGDHALLSRLLDNVLENAVNYAQRKQVDVALSVDAAKDAVCLRVSDQGPGVPQRALDKLGTPFFRVEGARMGGSGLGLSVVKHIAEAHGGSVLFENLEPTGFAVTLTLPLAREG